MKYNFKFLISKLKHKMKNLNKRQEKYENHSARFSAGFTLIELLIVFTILIILSGIIFAFQRDFFSLNSFLQKSFLAQNDVRRVITEMTSELRTVQPSNVGAFPLEITSPFSIAFYADIDDDASRERIFYFLSGNTLMKSIIYPSKDGYATVTPQAELLVATEYIKPVLKNVIVSSSTPIFTYFDRYYAGTSSPLVAPVLPSQVQHVGISLKVDEVLTAPPDPISASSKVTLRNLIFMQ